jgi:putative ABC transport system permease protein
VRVGFESYEVIGVMAKRPSPGGFNMGEDDFVIIPHTTYQKVYKIKASDVARGQIRSVQISAVPWRGLAVMTLGSNCFPFTLQPPFVRSKTKMRVRHGLRLDQDNDFDLATQDAILKIFDQVVQGAFLALVVLSSIALMVGGIGVMSIMTISVTERTREIGVRKALGARRVEILWQFLLESVFLTSAGGILDPWAPASAGSSTSPPDLSPALVNVHDQHRLLGDGRRLSMCPPSARRVWTRSKLQSANSIFLRARGAPPPLACAHRRCYVAG